MCHNAWCYHADMRILYCLLVASLASALVTPAQAAPDKPNILFFFADDLRASALGCYGHPDAKTPNIDKLASQGTLFTRAYIMGGNQGAVCVPSRAMQLSGRSLFTVDSALKNTPTWPMALREAGYAANFSGKWHNGAASAAASFPGARSVFLGGMSDQFKVKLVDLRPASAPATDPAAGTAKQSEKHSSEVFADEAIRFIEAGKGAGKAWVMYVPFTAPHDPREAPKEWHDQFDPAKMTVPANFLPEHPFDNGELTIRDEKLEKFPRTKEAIQKHWADYHAIIAHMDAQIGRVLAALEASGQSKNTIVIFAADNGLAMGSHGLMGKQSVYEHSVQVPLIISGAGGGGAGGLPAGKKSDALCYILDLCPTICELAGAKPPEGSIGKSLVPVVRGETNKHRDALVFAYRNLMRGVRDEQFKAIWYPPINRWQLFDLTSDPLEQKDLSADPQHAETLAAMQKKLTTLRTSMGDNAELPAKQPGNQPKKKDKAK